MHLPPARHPQDPIIVETMLANLADVVSIYRFGSAGSEFERADSDLDIAILADHKLAFDERLNLAVRLSREVGRDVDIVDMRAIPVTLRVQIAANGARLNEERAGILEDIRQRGRIYG